MISFKARYFIAFMVIAVAVIQLANAKSQDVSKVEKAYINGIAQNASIKKAMSFIVGLDAKNIEDLITLTEIPAPPFQEQKRAEYFASMLKNAGLKDVSIDKEGNVIGRRPGTKGNKVVALAAHLDTVFPMETDVNVRSDGNKFIAPGIGDNTRGLVLVLSVLKAMEDASIQTEADVLFIGNVGEEGLGDLRGVKQLFSKDSEKIDAYIGIDGGKNNRLIYGGVGSHRYRVAFSGPGGHSWGAFGMANPHHALGRAIALFDESGLDVTTSGPKTTYNVGRIGGGTSINSIPFESWAEIDIRSGTQSKLDKIDAILHKTVRQALHDENKDRTTGPEITVGIKRIGTRPAGLSDKSLPIIQHAMASMLKVGIEPRLAISSTDANIPISMGVPAITLSRGGVGGRAHSLDEWWENEDSHIAIQVAFLTVVAQAGMAENK